MDGSWDLDGSHRLDVTRGYQLGVAIVAMVAFAHNEVTDVLKVRSAYDLRTGSDVRAAIRSEFEADFGIPSIWTENCYSTEIRRWSTEAVINDLKHQLHTTWESKEKIRMYRCRSLPKQGITGFSMAAIC